MKTRLDVVEGAFRVLGIKAEDESLTADQIAYAGGVLDGLFAELSFHAPVTWWPDQIEDAVQVSLSRLLASEIAPAYQVPAEPRAVPFARVMAVMRGDNRVNRTTEPEYF